MSLKDLLSLSGVPGLEPAITTLFELYKSVEKIKVYREQCKRMHSRCIGMLLTLRDNHESMFGTDYQNALDEADANIEHIASKLNVWSTWGRYKALMNQSEIQQGLVELDRDLEHCIARLNLAAHKESFRKQDHMGVVMDGHHAEIEEKLQRLLASTQDIQNILNQPDTNIRDHMLSIQQAIHDDVAAPETLQSLRERLLKIHRKTELLPPMIDLADEVRRIGDHPVNSTGGHSDVYLGEWLGDEKVALKLTRGLNHTQKAQKRFINEVAIWRQLQHKNVARLYGVASLGDHIYAVSPWMENRDALTYVTSNAHVDRLKLLCEVATGLEFLHKHGVIHGDLRGANILISEAEVACITDFGLSVLIEEEVANAPSPSSTVDNAGNCRWMAPELIKPSIIGLKVAKPNIPTDVWSYGMLCLEILTGLRPFNDCPNAAAVILDLVTGVRPTRPPADATRRGLSTALWELMQRCWHQNPQSRPSMSDILPRMRAFQAERAHVSNGSSSRTPSRTLLESPTASGSSLRSGQAAAPRRSSPISIPPPLNNIITSESPISLTPPFGSHRATPSNSSQSSHTRPSTAGSTTSSSGNLFTTSPRIKVQGFNPAPSSFHAALNTHSKSASLGVDPSRTKGQPRSSRPATADATKSVAPRLPGIGEIHNEVAGEDFGDFISYWQAVSDDPKAIPTVQLQRAATPEPGVASSLPNSFIAPVDHIPPRPVFDSAPSEGSSNFSVSSGHSPTSSANDETPIERPVYIKSRNDGTVEAATLPGLVERLIIDSKDFRKDMQFREIFLASYQAFSEAEEVFGLLIERFEAVSSPLHGEQRANVRASVRYSVLTVLDLWLRCHHVAPKDIPLLYQMREFTISVKNSSPAPTLGESAQRLSELIDSTVNRVLAPDPPLTPASSASSVRSAVRPSAISPQSLALALTMLESDRYRTIIPSDCIGWLKGIRESNGISTFIAENDKLSHWVQKSILKPDVQSQRSENLRYFLCVAEECRKLRNFSSACALFAGLASSGITGLKRTSLLDKPSTKVFLEAEKLMATKSNFDAYRRALNESQDPCVPWFRVHLHDLKAIHESHRTFIKQDGYTRVINFDIYYRLYERVRHILSYQESSYKIADSPDDAEVQHFVGSQLRALIVDDALRDWLHERATKLGHEERIDYNNHRKELVAIGVIKK